MGNALSGVLGLNSQYKPSANAAGNPYSQDQLQQDLARQNQIYSQQQALGQQLQSQMNGTGPNPAQTQLHQNVAQNNAQIQGSIASQRGLNRAIAAKLGANAAAQSNEQAAGQSAVLQQQQQLNATNALGGLYGQEQQGNLEQQGLYSGSNLGASKINAGVAAGNQEQAGSIIGGIFGGGGAALGLKKAMGGMIQRYADGGMTDPESLGNALVPAKAMSIAGKFLSGMSGQTKDSATGPSQAPQNPVTEGLTQLGKGIGNVVKKSQGGPINFTPGGAVPGQAITSGDSLQNDTVPAMVSPGEIVIPRHITQSPDAAKKAAEFVAAVLSRNSSKRNKK